MKRKGVWLGVCGGLLVGGLGFVNGMGPVDTTNGKVHTFVIGPGQPAAVTIARLKEAGLARSALVARVYMRWTGVDQRLRPGSYELSRDMDLGRVVAVLTAGPRDVWVTIPEGLRREQIAARVDAALTGPTKKFSAEEFVGTTRLLEGQLFPDSYLLPVEVNASGVIAIMTGNFTRKSGLVLPRDRETLILASILEREAKLEADRRMVAGILLKRLKAGWLLQVDATVQYGQNKSPDWWTAVVDTKQPSPYNTYLHSGLPPTPIANPGAAAISAALLPRESDYWFYLHDKLGVAHYGATLGEHQLNIDKYLRL